MLTIILGYQDLITIVIESYYRFQIAFYTKRVIVEKFTSKIQFQTIKFRQKTYKALLVVCICLGYNKNF